MSCIDNLVSKIPTAVAVFLLGGLGAASVQLLVGGALPWKTPTLIELDVIPERFVELTLPERVATLPAIGAPQSMSTTSDRMVAESAGLLGALSTGIGGLLGAKGERVRAKREEGRIGRKDGGVSGTGAVQEAEARATLRAWFPETFLFEPLVITDEAGRASLELPVPDRLTDWRVLGLAHDRAGRQAGDLVHFASTMPLYLDLPEPPTMRVGDRLVLPLQAVNQRAEPWRGELRSALEGSASLHTPSRTLQVGAAGAEALSLLVRADRPGPGVLEVELGSVDRVSRPVTVVPTGRPVVETVAGSLSSARELSLELPAAAVPKASTLELTVYPGPLAVLDAELARAGGQDGSLQESAYAYALTGRGRDLAKRMGIQADDDALRALRLRSYQDLVRHARVPSVQQALVLLAAVRGWPEDPLAARLAERLAGQLAHNQSPDGSFAAGWRSERVSLEHALAFTAEAARLTGELEPRVAQRAEGFVARQVDGVRDAHTAAALLAAGLVEPRHQPALRALVREAVELQEGGTATMIADDRARTAEGSEPGQMERCALAVLALDGDPESEALRQALGSTLLASYDPLQGFGDGLVGLLALDALAALFDQPLPESVQVKLWLDGQVVATQRLDLAAGFTPSVARHVLPSDGGTHSVRIEAEPALPGLGFTLAETHWLAPTAGGQRGGFELRVDTPATARVGEPATVGIVASPPGGEGLDLLLELPAGMEPDEPSLEALEDSETILAWESAQGRLRLELPPQPDGALFQADLRLIPTVAGLLHWGRATLALADDPALFTDAAPRPWEVRP